MSGTDDSQSAEQSIGVLLLTVPQVASMCQVSVDKVYEWAKDKRFPVVAGSHQIRIHARLFEEWLEWKATQGRQAVEDESQEHAA